MSRDGSRRLSLAAVLTAAGYEANNHVELRVDGSTLTLHGPGLASLTLPDAAGITKDSEFRDLPIFALVACRRGQLKFRNGLTKCYGAQCQVTGCNIMAILEAAHIKPYSAARNMRIDNGLLLRADIHTLFDLNLLGIEPTSLKIRLHPSINKEYGTFDDKVLRGIETHRPAEAHLRQRFEQFQRHVAMTGKS